MADRLTGRSDPERLDRALLAAAPSCAVYDIDCETRTTAWTGLGEAFGSLPPAFDAEMRWWGPRVHPDDRARALAEFEAALAPGAGRSYSSEYRFRAEDGRYRDVLDRAVIVRDETGVARRVLGAMLDVTEARRLESALSAAGVRYRELVESLPLVTYVDEANELASSIFISPQVEAMLGYAPEEWLADRDFFRRVLHPEDRERVMADLALPDDGADRYTSEYRLVARDGRTVWVQDETIVVRDAAGAPLYVQGYLLDVSERKRAELELVRRQATLEAVTFAAERLLEARTWTDALADVLERLGASAGATRASVWEAVRDGPSVVARCRGEWVAGGPAPADGVAARTLDRDAAERLEGGEAVLSSSCAALPLSGVRVPIATEEGWWGYLSLDDTDSGREWSAGEIEALRALAGILGAAIRRARVEERLKRANEDWQAVASTIRCAIYEWDVATDEIAWAEGMTTAFGYPLGEVDSSYSWWRERIHPDDVDRIDGLVLNALAGRGEYEAEYRFRAHDGSYRYVWDATVTIRDGTGRALRMVGGMVDITTRRETEEALRRSERQYRLLFEQNPSPMWVVDADSHRFLAVNDAAVESYGWSRREFLALTAADIRPEEDVPALLEDLARRRAAFGAGASFYDSGIWRHRRRDGTMLEAHVVASPIAFADRPAFLVLAEDVTEKRRLEEALRQSQKMEAVGRRAGGIAHDFNNLLTAIGGYADLAATRLAAGEDATADLEEIRAATERAAELTRQLLAFGRRQALRPAAVPLNGVVADMERLLERVLGEDVTLELRLHPDAGAVWADRGQLEQILMNLAVNARDAMPTGGVITIETRPAADGRDELAELARGGYAVLEVSDTGVGMDGETRAHVFEPFFTTKEIGQGTGLGLATVYGIVEQSGGHIRVESQPGRGSTFTVYLTTADRSESSSEPGGAPGAGATVLRAD